MADIKPAEGEVDATPAALAHAASLGVDISKIVGTGKDGKVTKTDVELAVGAKEEETTSISGPYYYCTEENHPGAPNFQTTPLSLTRIFRSSEDVPFCPACNKQTNSIPCDGPDIPPASILDLQERFGR